MKRLHETARKPPASFFPLNQADSLQVFRATLVSSPLARQWAQLFGCAAAGVSLERREHEHTSTRRRTRTLSVKFAKQVKQSCRPACESKRKPCQPIAGGQRQAKARERDAKGGRALQACNYHNCRSSGGGGRQRDKANNELSRLQQVVFWACSCVHLSPVPVCVCLIPFCVP